MMTESIPGSRLETGLAGLGTLRWVAADLTLVVEEARRRHDLSPVAAVALGRAMTGAALLQRISLKQVSRLVLEVKGDGPLGSVIAEVNSAGELRGMVGEPRVATPVDGGMRIAEAVGAGSLRVTREESGGRYSSQVELVSGELGDDLTHYLHQSEQIRSAVLLGVLPRPTGIAAAGGLVVEALPGTENEVIGRLEEGIRSVEGVSACLAKGGVDELVVAVLGAFDREILERQPLDFRCRCDRETLLPQLRSMAKDDLSAVVGSDGKCEAVCAFCGERYLFDTEELRLAH
jgi:molecular chaperone Hsp33